MQLGLLLAVVAGVTISEGALHRPVSASAARLLFSLAASGTVVLLAYVGSTVISRSLLRHNADQRTDWLAIYASLKRVHMVVWLGSVVWIFHELGWPRIVRYNWGMDQMILVRDIVVLTPIWAPILLSWTAFYRVEWAMAQTVEGQGNASSLPTRSRFVWLQARHFLGLCILPVLVLLAFQDVLTRALPGWNNTDYAWLLYALPLGILIIIFPAVLCRIWKTSPLPAGPLRERLEHQCRQTGITCREFKIWHTDHQFLNAAVAGIVRPMRYVLLTDALLTHLAEDEIEAVVLHELGHIHRRHILLRILVLSLPVWIVANVQAFQPHWAKQVAEAVGSWHVGPTPILPLLIPVVTAAYLIIALGWHARLLEYDADLCVLERGRGGAFIDALRRLARLTGEESQRGGWLHPSTSQRISKLGQAALHPETATAFRRHITAVNRLIILSWIALPSLFILLHSCLSFRL